MSRARAIPIFILVAAAAIIAAVLVSGAGKSRPDKNPDRGALLPTKFFDFAQDIRTELAKAEAKVPKSLFVQAGVTSHHLPTAIPLIAEFYRNLQSSTGPRQTFVVVGPDHFERCLRTATVSDRPYQTPFGVLPIDTEIVKSLVATGVSFDAQCMESEHSVAVQAIFIRLAFPDAKIVPILLSSSSPEIDRQKILGALNEFRDRIIVVCSTDFSHYRGIAEANSIDMQSQKMFEKGDLSAISLEQIDSPPSIKLTYGFAAAVGAGKSKIVDHKNSFDFTGQAENTTSYFDIFFHRPDGI